MDAGRDDDDPNLALARLLALLLRRSQPSDAGAPLEPDPSAAAAWEGMAQAAEMFADHARFFRDRAGGARP